MPIRWLRSLQERVERVLDFSCNPLCLTVLTAIEPFVDLQDICMGIVLCSPDRKGPQGPGCVVSEVVWLVNSCVSLLRLPERSYR